MARKQNPRQTLAAKADRAERLLRDPAFVDAFNAVRNDHISTLERSSLATPEERDTALEHVRQLQALLSVKTRLVNVLRAENSATQRESVDSGEPITAEEHVKRVQERQKTGGKAK